MRYRIKYLIIAAYVLAVAFLWSYRWELFGLFPIDAEHLLYPLYRPAVEVFCLVMALLGLYGIIKFSPTARRLQKGFEKIGFHNQLGEYPRLISMSRGKYRAHEVVYKFESKQISLPEWEKQLANLEAILNAKISFFEYGRRSDKQVLVHAVPRKFVKPTLITASDSAFGSIEISALINLLIVGATGTGKTGATKIILNKIVHSQPNAEITILDYKGYDFRGFAKLPNYYAFNDCVEGLNNFYNSFKAQQATGKAGAERWVVVDEWGAFILAQEKKQAEQLKAKLAELLMLGRSYNYRVLCGLQRADATHFDSGSRDQFKTTLALGNLSKEQKQMLFADEKDKMTDINGLGEGYLHIDGFALERVKIERVKDFSEIDSNIAKAMSRRKSDEAGGEAKREPPAWT